MQKPVRPTEAELEILSALWESGPSTVRQLHEKLSEEKPRGYTTVLKLLQIMMEKGFVDRTEAERAHVYRAVLPLETARDSLLGLVKERLFGGSATSLAMHAVGREASPEKLRELQRFLEDWEKK